MRFFWNVVHNCFVHPVMPLAELFGDGRVAKAIDRVHGWTADKAFGDDA